ncbi:MAG: hypothetical protein UW19_C0018G0003 [Candidatus Moranbacteria bacterium GW2011_GWF2_44_10]|nr:MAG: hypothetical protein UW19_C0018G0003 [Candidatus Moranbacteria bacterium GW2011_GWF2_44_10]
MINFSKGYMNHNYKNTLILIAALSAAVAVIVVLRFFLLQSPR